MKMDDKTKAWIEKAKKVHGDRYDYSQVVYISSTKKIDIHCRKHGLFHQVAAGHISGKGCPKCGGRAAKGANDFIVSAVEKHGNKYDYSSIDLSMNIKYKDKVPIRCIKHDFLFTQSAGVHINGSGCSKCRYDVKRNSTDEFLLQAVAIHGDKYNYSKVIYVALDRKVKIVCKKKGHTFEQTPNNHITNKRGCPKCCGIGKTTDELILEFKAVHGNKYDYSKFTYKYQVDGCIICLKHGEFFQNPYNHLKGHGCPACSHSISRKAVEWIEFVASCNDDKIDHILNGGEYKIGKYRVDGYCQATNTCYEFHGTLWHAHPAYHDPNALNTVTKKLNQDIYEKTLDRENYIRSKGYNLVVMWEHDWDDICKWFLK